MKLSIVIPCYNEQEVLPQTAELLRTILQSLIDRREIDAASRIWFVDDGSRDSTWSIIERLVGEHDCFMGIKLAANRGHQYALLAGLSIADGDAVISMDADLQDDPQIVEKMIAAFKDGHDIVYGVRNDRSRDSWFKRWSAERYYALLRLLGVVIVPNHADYRLMSRKALEALSGYHEVNLFLRGVVPHLGFRNTSVYYQRHERLAGVSKYPLRKMLGLAIDGVTSFSPVPLRIIAVLGALVFLFSAVVALWVLTVRFTTTRAVPGWASITLPIYALGGIQLLSLGVVGEYVAKAYMEAKRRPRFIVETVLGSDQNGTEQRAIGSTRNSVASSLSSCH